MTKEQRFDSFYYLGDSLETLIKESNDISISLLSDDFIYMESENNEENKLKKITDRIKDIIRKIKEKIISLFRSKETTEQIKEIEQAGLSNDKVEMTDYNKIQDLQEKTMKEIDKSHDQKDVNEVIEKYKKQRNKILKGAAVITVTLGAAITSLKLLSDKKIKGLQDKVDLAEMKYKDECEKVSRISKDNNKLKNKAIDLQKENKKLKNKVDVMEQDTLKGKLQTKTKQINEDIQNKSENINRSMNIEKAKLNAKLSVISDAASDLAKNASEVKNKLSQSKSLISKTSIVSNGIKEMGKSVKKAVNGETLEKNKNARKRELEAKISEINDKRKRAERIIKSSTAPKEKKDKASEYLNKTKDAIKRMKDEIKEV